jgi:SLOG cluster2
MTALTGRSVALSVSDAPDRSRLGFPAREVDRALFSICTVLVRAGAKIVYAGNLDPNGLTFSMFRHLTGAYAAAHEKPFMHIVPEPILRGVSFDGFISALREGSAVVETLIHIEDNLLPIRAVEDGLRIGEGRSRIRLGDHAQFENWLSTKRTANNLAAFSLARKAVTEVSDARILLGGRMGLLDHPNDAYQGAMPGIVEEAIFALEAGLPCVPLGAFGGAARDVAIALNLMDPSKRVPRGEQSPTYGPSLEQVAVLRGSIPSVLLPELTALADDDRGEPMAYEVAQTLERWLAQ